MYLRFDFEENSYHFSKPVEIISTKCINDVLNKLKKVELAVEAGFYAAGFLSYESSPAFNANLEVKKPSEIPLLWFAVFEKSDVLFAGYEDEKKHSAIQWQNTTSYSDYQKAIHCIHTEIEKGNTYQVNYTTRLQANFDEIEDYDFYLYLLNAQRAKYMAYLDIGDFKILSASPELFFKRMNNKIITKPMKGTLARGKSYLEDQKQYDRLKQSAKNKAENSMIVDLLRNDLGQIAKTGSVQVSKLFEIEKFPTVWQMTSTVEAAVDPQITLIDIFKALFPCGSITGAPKKSTMQIIRSLEETPRGIYCGAIGFITPKKEAIFNVPIRTVEIDKKQHKMVYGTGGGITWDSTDKDEYQEMMDKANILFGIEHPRELLETLLLDNGNYYLLEEHLQRLSNSAEYFDFYCDSKIIRRDLASLAKQYSKGKWKVRLLLNSDKNIVLEIELIDSIPILEASWSPFAIHKENRFLYHKTNIRDQYPKVTKGKEYLLYNEQDEITEFVNGNVALLIGNEWLTPVLESGLLPGTMRSHLLAKGKIKEALLLRSDLIQAKKIAFLNSVRGWIEIKWNQNM